MIDNDNNLYKDNLRRIKQKASGYLEGLKPSTWEANWLYDFIPYQDNEEVRACAVLPLIKVEIEQNNISEEMLNELGYYYDEVIVYKTLDNIFNDPEEKEMFLKDLKWCYETAKQRGLID